MSEESAEKPKRRIRNRTNEVLKRKIQRQTAAAARMTEQASAEALAEQHKLDLAMLAARGADLPTDADRDIDFAYKHSGNPNLKPLDAPSLGAWQWYEFAKADPTEFLKICAKREDAKAKQAGTISAQRMEDDKRQQFAVIDRIVKQLKIDVKAIAKELMEKCPEDLLDECRKNREAWAAYFQKKPL